MINKTQGIKGINTKFSYSHVVENLASVFVSGGEVLEYVNFFRDEWQNTEINNQECGLASLPFTAFFAERGYRLVVQRTLVQGKRSTLFDCWPYSLDPLKRKKDEDSSSSLTANY